MTRDTNEYIQRLQGPYKGNLDIWPRLGTSRDLVIHPLSIQCITQCHPTQPSILKQRSPHLTIHRHPLSISCSPMVCTHALIFAIPSNPVHPVRFHQHPVAPAAMSYNPHHVRLRAQAQAECCAQPTYILPSWTFFPTYLVNTSLGPLTYHRLGHSFLPYVIYLAVLLRWSPVLWLFRVGGQIKSYCLYIHTPRPHLLAVVVFKLNI